MSLKNIQREKVEQTAALDSGDEDLMRGKTESEFIQRNNSEEDPDEAVRGGI